MFFGRLEWYKGIDTLIHAWTRLGQNVGGRPGPEAPRLILAGRSADGLTLPALPPRVELRNRSIPDDEALELFGQAALLVLPYRDATQSALIAAAARLGVPSLVTCTGALPEYVQDASTGFVVPPEDPEALASALQYALCNPDHLQRMGRAAHAWYENARIQELNVLGGLYQSPSQRAGAAKPLSHSHPGNAGIS
jgi:glycosyltransferase involved in cell wall biosynthesis